MHLATTRTETKKQVIDGVLDSKPAGYANGVDDLGESGFPLAVKSYKQKPRSRRGRWREGAR
jgi:hypothetical protein